MASDLNSLRRTSTLFLLAVTLVSAGPAPRLRNPGTPAQPPEKRPTTVTARAILWRSVTSPDGTYGGAISDVLVNMPSGRILYVVVDRNEPFRFPKAITPDSLKRGSDEKFHCSLSLARWLTAPVVDGTGTRVERFTDKGYEIIGYAEPAWAPLAPRSHRGLAVVAPAPGQPRPVPFVSLQRLRRLQIDSIGGEPIGSVAGYLVDWPRRRVTHALLASGHATTPSVAIPMIRLMPRIGEGAPLFVNTQPAALQQAPIANLASDAWQRFPDRIFRYRAPRAMASNR